MQLNITNPYTQQIITTVEYADAESIAHTVAAAAQSFAAWRQVPLSERCQIVHCGLKYFSEHAKEIAAEVSEQMGKPIFEYDIYNCPKELKGQLKIGDFNA